MGLGFWPGKRNAWIGVALIGVFLMANTVISLGSARHLIRNGIANDRARRLINSVNVVVATLIDAETGERGYVITGDDSYLEPYTAAYQHIDLAVEDLAELAHDTPEQLALIRELNELARLKFEEMAIVIRVRQNNRALADRLIATNEGKALMDQIRQAARKISEDASRQLLIRATASAKSAIRLEAAILLGLAIGLILIFSIAYAIYRDAIIRGETEAKLIESSRFARSTIDALHSHIAILDETGMIIATNSSWREFAAANSGGEELRQGGNYLEVCDRASGPCSEEAADVAAGIRSILNGERADVELEYPCHSPTQRRWFLLHVTRFAEDGPVRLVVSHEDITEIKIAHLEREAAFAALDASHQALRSNEQHYRELTNLMPQLAWSALPSGAADYFNQGWLAYTGRTLEQEQGDGWIQSVHPDDRQPSLNCWKAAAARGSLYNTEYRVRRASDGTYRWFLARGVPVRGPDGTIVKWYGTTTDIDDQKRLAEELKEAKAEADKANSAKSEFLAHMSHEIRTPMNGVLGMSDVLLDSDLSSEQRDAVEIVKSSADSLMIIINDILDFSKIEARRMELHLVEFQLHDCIYNAITSLAFRAHHKGLELTIDCPQDVPDNLVGDPNRLRQIIVNLVGNAIKFTELGEVILQVRAASQENVQIEIAFEVIDTGVGIPPDKLQTIFEPFSQADSSFSRVYGGSGLGLSISSQLIQMMGGQLTVTSRIGHGSTFHFIAHFNAPRTSPIGHSPKWHIAAPMGCNVLIVDDNATSRRVLGEKLRDQGLNPKAVSTAADALTEIESASAVGEPYQLALIDSAMPGVNGFALVAQVHTLSIFAPPMIMMLTSSDRTSDAERCGLNHMPYLIKPIQDLELFRAISDCVFVQPPDVGIDADNALSDDTPAPSISAAGLPSFHILLAEDNLVNQRIARGLLEKRGHNLVVAENGKEALDLYANDRFDLILMDLQMPVLDGLEVTAQIRQLEANTDQHTPIVAMTSHAFGSDEQRCLAGGMDAYLTKPIDRQVLFSTIARVIKNAPLPRHSMSAPTARPNGDGFETVDRHRPSVDFEILSNRVESDWNLLQEIIELFLDNSPHLLTEIEVAVERGDRQGIERTSHALKGAMLSIAADPAAQAASRLEKASRHQDFDDVVASLADLKQEMNRLMSRLSIPLKMRT